MADIFLSYAREDLATAAKLAQLLEANGLSVWWDRRLVAGDEINDAIEKAVDEAKAVVVLWSTHSVGSRWVRGEAETAAEAEKLVPVKIAPCKLPIAFRGIHTPEVFASRQQIDDLAGMLSAKLRPGAQPQAKITLSPESSGRFLSDLAGIMQSPSTNFSEQFKRELEFGNRHPWLYWGGGIVSYAAVVALVAVTGHFDIAESNALVAIIALIAYFAYRRYRLSRTS